MNTEQKRRTKIPIDFHCLHLYVFIDLRVECQFITLTLRTFIKDTFY